MSHTHCQQDLREIVPGRAYSYGQGDGGYAALPITRTYITVPPEELAQFAGNYPLPQIGQRAVVELRDGRRWAAGPVNPPLEIKAVGGRKYHLAQLQADIEFAPQDGGGMKIIITHPAGVFEGERTEPFVLDAAASTGYEGAYWSDEMLTQYAVGARDGKLWLSHLKHGETKLETASADVFSSGWWFMPEIRFARDASGRSGRITGLTFRKSHPAGDAVMVDCAGPQGSVLCQTLV